MSGIPFDAIETCVKCGWIEQPRVSYEGFETLGGETVAGWLLLTCRRCCFARRVQPLDNPADPLAPQKDRKPE